jgi:hypothetical protein
LSLPKRLATGARDGLDVHRVRPSKELLPPRKLPRGDPLMDRALLLCADEIVEHRELELDASSRGNKDRIARTGAARLAEELELESPTREAGPRTLADLVWVLLRKLLKKPGIHNEMLRCSVLFPHTLTSVALIAIHTPILRHVLRCLLTYCVYAARAPRTFLVSALSHYQSDTG